MFGKTSSRRPGSVRRGWLVGLVPGLVMGVIGTACATTLQDYFDSTTSSFTQDGLTFSDFKPVLSTMTPSPGNVLGMVNSIDPIYVASTLQNVLSDPNFVANTLQNNPSALSDFGNQFLDFSGGGVFSRGWGNASAANPDNIYLTILPDAPGGGVDPGFKLEGASEWQVDAGFSTPNDTGDDNPSAQLSAFAYTVTREPQMPLLTSADLTQDSVIDAIGPDYFSFSPFEWPDVAGGFALQFILDDQNPDDFTAALMNYTLESGVRISTSFFNPSFTEVVYPAVNQDRDWEGFLTARDSIRVVTVTGLGATSGGGFTMNSLSQRIDPPLNSNIPEPETVLLMLMGMLGLGALRRRRV